MITVKLKGGLGNQMFQYVTGLAVAFMRSQELKLDTTGYDDPRVINSDIPRKYGLYVFNISGNIHAYNGSLLDLSRDIKQKGQREFRIKLIFVIIGINLAIFTNRVMKQIMNQKMKQKKNQKVV